MGKVPVHFRSRKPRLPLKHARRADVLADRFEGLNGPIDTQHMLISLLLPPAVKQFMQDLDREVEQLCGSRYSRGQAKSQFEKSTANECQQAIVKCSGQPAPQAQSCTDQKTCRVTARERALTCLSRSPQQEIELIKTLEGQGDLEGASYWRRVFFAQFPQRKISSNFPIEAMKKELTGSGTQARAVRWASYYASWKESSATDSPQARAYLAPIVSTALLNNDELLGREKSLTAHENQSRLFVSARRSGLFTADQTAQMVDSLRGNPKANDFYVEAITLGSRDGSVSNDEVKAILQKLTDSSASATDLKSAAMLMRYVKLDRPTLDQLTPRLLQHQSISDETLSRLAEAGGSDKPTQGWLKQALAISKNPNVGPETINKIAISLYVGTSPDTGFPPGSSNTVSEIVKNLTVASAPDKSQNADMVRVMLSAVEKTIPK